MSAEQTEAMAEAILPPELREEFRRRHEADFAYSVPGLGRFRTNAYRQRGSVALAMRRVRSVASGLRESACPRWCGGWPRSAGAWCW